MRGLDERSGTLFSYVDLEARVRRDHRLRAIPEIVNGAFEALTVDFGALYSRLGRPSISPEKLLIERERIEFDLVFRWFVGLGVDDSAWDHSSFSKNRTGCWRARSRPSSCGRCWPSPRSSG